MFKKNNTNIILALCISGVLIAFVFSNRHAALPKVPAVAFYTVVAVFFLLRRKVCRKQCEA
jgi:hypothetical protein